MKIAVSILWLIFAGVFAALGWSHWIEADRQLPPFELTQRGYEVSGSGFQVKIDVRGTPLDQPFENLVQDLNAYFEERDRRVQAANRRAAWGYFLAAATAIACALLQRRAPPAIPDAGGVA